MRYVASSLWRVDALVKAVLTRDAILGHVFPPVGTVDVPELGGQIAIAGLSAGRSDAVQKRPKDENPDTPFNVWATITFAADAEGNPLFTEADAPALAKLPDEALNKIAIAALDMNGMSKKAQDEAKNDSGATGTSGSDTGSPSPLEEQSPS